ncbi:MAG: hypothetical protein IJY88_02970 [Clostridia bacterium]|nr:hypothetical protein [Clostridia bacterium]
MLNRIYSESWNVAFRNTPTGDILNNKSEPFTIIKNNFRYWAADPFVLEIKDKVYVFAELFDYILRRGILGYCTISDNKASKWTPIIKEPYHLSFPCVFMQDGVVYLMPESNAGEVLTLYKCEEFPCTWKRIKTLRSNVKFADTTPMPFPWQRYAVTHSINDVNDPKLLLIDTFGEEADRCVPHENTLRSRPAGHFLSYKEKMLRPAQYSEDNDKGYGKSLVFYECKFDGSEYSEIEFAEIKPEEQCYNKRIYLNGMHTYNSSEHYEVIDLKTRRFNPLDFIMRLLGKVF